MTVINGREGSLELTAACSSLRSFEETRTRAPNPIANLQSEPTLPTTMRDKSSVGPIIYEMDQNVRENEEKSTLRKTLDHK
jgi:hypothetical protein